MATAMMYRVLISADEEKKAYDISIGKLAVLSTSLASSTLIAYQCAKHYREKGRETSTVVRFLGLKAVADFITEVFQLNFAAFQFHSDNIAMPDQVCILTGFMTQYFIVASMTLNFCIALDVFLLLANPWTYDTEFWRNRMLIFVFVLCSGTSFGLLGADQLGNSGNGNCWVKNPSGTASWFLYGPCFFYEGFCIIALLFFAFKVRRISSVRNNSTDGGGDEFFRSSLAKRMLLKMVLFTGIYIISWSVILVRHIVQLNDPKNYADIPHYNALTNMASFFVDAFGIWDLFVW